MKYSSFSSRLIGTDFIKIRQKILPVAAKEEDAPGLFFQTKLQGAADLVAVLVQIVHGQRMRSITHVCLQLLYQCAEKLVGSTFDQHQNGIGVLLLQLFGVGIELEAGGGCCLQNDLAGLFTDIGLIVQHPGNRADTVAGLGGKIFDRHKYAFFHGRMTCGGNVSFVNPV